MVWSLYFFRMCCFFCFARIDHLFSEYSTRAREKQTHILENSKENSNEHTTSNAVLYIVNFNFDHAI